MPKKPPPPADLTLQVLIQIRDRLDSLELTTSDRFAKLQLTTNNRFAELHTAISETNYRLEGFERRVTDTEMRLATELVALAGAAKGVRDLLKEELAERYRVLEQRVLTLEQKAS